MNKWGMIAFGLFVTSTLALPANGQLVFTNNGLTADNEVIDSTGDNLGDSVGTVGNATLRAGEVPAGSNTNENRGVLVFNISSLTNQIIGSTNVSLFIRFDSRTPAGGPVPFDADLRGLLGFRTSTNVVASDFQASSTLLKASYRHERAGAWILLGGHTELRYRRSAGRS